MPSETPTEAAKRAQGLTVLAHQNFGRRHQGALRAAFDRREHREKGHDRLAGADVALQETQHALRRGEIGIDFGHRRALRIGQLIG